jgi:LacI family transcriptional regulator
MQRRHIALLIEASNSYARGLLRGIHAYVREHQRWTIFFPEQGRGDAPPAALKNWRGHGMIARIENAGIARAIRAKDLPTVDVSAAGLLPDLPCFETDNEEVARAALEHLRARGFKNLAFCGDDRFQWSRERGEWFCNLARQAHCECSAFPPRSAGIDETSAGGHDDKRLITWIRQLRKPCGLMACYDIRGWQVLAACREIGVAVPDDIAVVGVDNDDLLCNLSEPPLSSVVLNPARTGYEAAMLLDQMMAGRAVAGGIRRIKPTGLVTRQSSDVLAISDPEVSQALRFIREHAVDGIKVEAILKTILVSRRVLESRFKKLLGHSPHDEILRVKLQRVKQLLEETDLPLRVIAERTGFTHVEYLSAVFKSHMGSAPSEYRQQHNVAGTSAAIGPA